MRNKVHVGIVAISEGAASTLLGLFDTLNFVALLAGQEGVPAQSPFVVEILGETGEAVTLASGITLPVSKASQTQSDIIIVPSVILSPGGWAKGRYPGLTDWLVERHRAGATICSACSGLFLIAETGLFDGIDATVHWPYLSAFKAHYGDVRVQPERALVVAGQRGELISSGASTSWHDLVLYLIGREIGPVAAQTVSKLFALQRHVDGLAPFIVFDPPTDHGDAVIAEAQAWLVGHLSIANPVRDAIARSALPERSFSRRFKAATGLAPLDYVQRLRIEQAKRRLERTGDAIEDIAWQVGYEEPAAFRRIFLRLTGISPGRYRRQFSLPAHG